MFLSGAGFELGSSRVCLGGSVGRALARGACEGSRVLVFIDEMGSISWVN